MNRRPLAVPLVLLPLAAGGLLLATPAAAESGSATVGDRVEAWYQSSAAGLCATPVGCTATAPPNPYPAGELHVGVGGGQESERSYLALDLASLPPGATLTGGLLTLPLSQDQSAGQVQVASAAIKACLVTKPFTDAEGATTAPPPVDCDTASRKARLAADAKAFTVDLAPFAAAWTSGVPNHGLALVPDAAAAGDTWQVSIDGRRATAPVKVSAGLTFDAPAAADPGSVAAPAANAPARGSGPASGDGHARPGPAPLPVAAGGSNPLPGPVPGSLPAATAAVPAPAPAAAPVAAPPAAAPVALAPQAVIGPVSGSWLSYRGAVYAPFAALVVLWLLGRALLRPVAPARHPAEGTR